MRPTLAALFALGLAATVLAGDGLVLVPHAHAAGTPADHPHRLALYRFPIAMLGTPADAPERASEPPSRRPSFRLSAYAGETIAGLALIVATGLIGLAFAARIRRTESAAPVIAWSAPQWCTLTPTGPPRVTVLRSV